MTKKLDWLSMPAIKSMLPLLLGERARKTILQSFYEDGSRCDPERLVRGLMFLYLIEYDSKEYKHALDNLISLLAQHTIDSNRLGNSTKADATEKAYTNGQVLMFALMRKSCVDYNIWNPKIFIEEGGFDDRDSFVGKFDPQRIEQRHKVVEPVLLQLDQVTTHRINQLQENRRQSVESVYNLVNGLFEEERDDTENLRQVISKNWSNARHLHSLFYRHDEITQPILLAAMMYCGITSQKDSDGNAKIQSSSELRKQYPAIYDMFYTLMMCAQNEGSSLAKSLPRRGESEDYFKLSPERRSDVVEPKEPKEFPQDQKMSVPDDFLQMLSSGALSTQSKEKKPVSGIWMTGDFESHVCCHRSLFKSFKPCDNRAYFKCVDGKELKTNSEFHRIEGIGSVRIMVRNQHTNRFESMIVHNVRYVPSLHMNLLSYWKLGCRVTFEEGALKMNFEQQPTQVEFERNEEPVDVLLLKSIVHQRYCFLDYQCNSDLKQQLQTIPEQDQVQSMSSLTECEYDPLTNNVYRLQ